MTYFDKDDYSERYYIPFFDIDGNEWRISIQDPTDSYEPIELTGASNPIEWFGVGDEDQTNVVLGSTGTLRLVCQQGQESYFAIGAIFPEVINDRRVVVTRKFVQGGQTNWYTIWQGFIKPEQYTQEWDSAPFEVELPLVSAIAATEFFTMPEYNTVRERSTIADLLWYVLDLLSCDFSDIITNKPVYEDFNGNIQYDESFTPAVPYHWTQGSASCFFFYDFEGDGIKPKTLKDVLETICYPYGKIYEYGNYVCIMMNAGKYINDDHVLFRLVMSSGTPYYHRFVTLENGTFGELNLSALPIASTSNSKTLLSKPTEVNFTTNLETQDDIFELTENYYKAPISVDVTSGNPSYRQYDARYRSLYNFDSTNVNTSFAKNLTSTSSDIFCRVVDVTGNNNDGYTYNTIVPLGLFIKPTESVSFELARPIRTIQYLNKARISFKVYAYPPNSYDVYGDASNPVHGKYTHGYAHREYTATLKVHVLDITNSNDIKYLDFTPSNVSSWRWMSYDSSISPISAEYLLFKNNDCVAEFNEPRASGDKAQHKIKVILYVENSSDASNLIPMFVQIKVEYVRDDSFTTSELKRVFEEVNDTIIGKKQIPSNGGAGESINVEFKTMCGRNYIVLNGSAYAPYNSFCDATTYIDTGNRKKLELEAVKFIPDFVRKPFLVNDGSTVFVPVAFGMSPRNNTARLLLVSTNIGTTQQT